MDERLVELMLLKNHIDYLSELITKAIYQDEYKTGQTEPIVKFLAWNKAKAQIEFSKKLKEYKNA
jgi:hypothetical protein